MEGPPAFNKPCCVCAGPGGHHCTKCKSRHYCSKKCQLVDWRERGHKVQCKELAVEFQDRMLDAIMPEKKPKEAPPIVEDVAPAAGSTAAARLSAVPTQTTAVVKAIAVHENAADWRGTCAICLDVLPVGGGTQRFYSCCAKKICADCSSKCDEYDKRCPLCRAPPPASEAEWLRRVQKHVDKGHAAAQFALGQLLQGGGMGLKQSHKRAFQLFQLAAAQGFALAQTELGACHQNGQGVKINPKTAAQWYRRAAEQGDPIAQTNLGQMFYNGKGVAQSYDEAVRWYRLAAAQSHAVAFNNLGVCYAGGQGVSQDLHEALRLFKRAVAQGHAGAAKAVDKLAALLAARSGRPN